MKTTSRKKVVKDDSYLKLVRAVPLRPLKSRREYHLALDMAKSLMLHDERSLDSGESDYLDVLSTLIERYETAFHPIPQVGAVDALKHLMEAHSMTINDLGNVIGHQPTASQIVNGKREMSKLVIIKLAQHFDVSPATFLYHETKRIAG